MTVSSDDVWEERHKLGGRSFRSSHSAMSFQEALAGGLGGLVANICVYPLDVAKTHLQAHSGRKSFSRSYTDRGPDQSIRYENETSFRRLDKDNDKQDSSQRDFKRKDNFLDALSFVVQREGWIGLYAGVVPSACKGMATSFIFYYFYSFLRPFFESIGWKLSSFISFQTTRHDRNENHKMRQLQHLSRSNKSNNLVSVLMPSIVAIAHGFFAACLTQVIILPLDMIVTRMQLRADRNMQHQMIDKEMGRQDSPCDIYEMNDAERIIRRANDKNNATRSQTFDNAIGDIEGKNDADQLLTSIREENDNIFSHTSVSLFEFLLSYFRRVRPGGFREAVGEIYSEGGLKHFWSSLFPGLLVCLNPGIRQATQGALRRGRPREKIHSGEIMIHGLLSAAAASLLTYPLSMIKTRFQSSRPARRVQTPSLRSSSCPASVIPWLPSVSSHSLYEAKATAENCDTEPTIFHGRKSNILIQDFRNHTGRYSSGCNARKQLQRQPPVQQSSEEVYINTKGYKDNVINNPLTKKPQPQDIPENKPTMFANHEEENQQESGNYETFPSYESWRTEYSNSSSTYAEVCCCDTSNNNDDGDVNDKIEAPSVLQCFSDILRSGGLLSLYNGLIPDLLKKACSEAILALIRDKIGYFFVLIAFRVKSKRRRQ